MSNWTQRVVSGIILLFVVVLANTQLLITLFIPPPVSYDNIPFPLDKARYNSDDTPYITVERCSTESTIVPATFSLNMIQVGSATNWQISEGAVFIAPGCVKDTVALPSKFPDNLPSGTYEMRGVTTVRGTYKTVDVMWSTQKFEFINTRRGE